MFYNNIIKYRMKFFSFFKNKEKLKLENLTLQNCEKFSFKNLEVYAKVLKVYDGDTITIGFFYHNKQIKVSCRLLGIDTPELRTKNQKEKEQAILARDYLKNKINDSIVKILFDDFDKYGRPLITIYKKKYLRTININELMVKKGYAYNYNGGKKEVF